MARHDDDLLLFREVSSHAEEVGRVRGDVRSVLGEVPVAPSDVDELSLLVTEACANVVRHAYDDPDESYRVWLYRSGDGVRLVVEDDGGRFDPDAIGRPRDEVSGRGYTIISALADNVVCRRSATGGAHVEVFKRLGPAN